MPDKYTFKMQPVKELLFRYVKKSADWIDPFAGYYSPAGITNDLNKNANAKYNLSALDFLNKINDKKYQGCLFDPPYSLRQIKECYKNIDIDKLTIEETQLMWNREKDIIKNIIKDNGYFIQFGWHSNGINKKYGFEIIEILLIAHGAQHYDTICTVQQKVKNNMDLFYD